MGLTCPLLNAIIAFFSTSLYSTNHTIKQNNNFMKMKPNSLILTMLFTVLLSIPALKLMAQNANTALSNLVSPTAINKSLLPNSDNTLDFGSSTKAWKHIYLDGSI